MMIVEIGYNNRVRCIYVPEDKEKVRVDNVKTFEVDSKPNIEKNTILYFNPQTREFYTEEKPKMPEIPESVKARMEAQQKKAAALKWLADNDWKINKRVLGEWTEDDPRWLLYLSGREAARADIDAADVILNG